MMTKLQKAVAFSLIMVLVVFAVAACGVPDEEDFEEMDDDFGYQLEVEESFAQIDFEIAEAPALNVIL